MKQEPYDSPNRQTQQLGVNIFFVEKRCHFCEFINDPGKLMNATDDSNALVSCAHARKGWKGN